MKPMLAVNVDMEKLRFPCLASPKLDGIRCLVDDELLSRSLKPIRNLHAQKSFSHLKGFDGELIVGDVTDPLVFNNTSAVMRVKGEPDVKLYVFDVWNTDMNYFDRFMSQSFPEHDNVVYVPSVVINNPEELLAYEHQMIQEGYEGIMIRDPSKLYKFGRATVNSQELLKKKIFVDDEFVIVGATEMMHNNNEASVNELGRTKRSSSKVGLTPSGMLGSLILKYGDTTFECGTGFTPALRRVLWLQLPEIVGKLAKIKYQEAGIKDLPRFPVFLGIRSEDDLGG